MIKRDLGGARLVSTRQEREKVYALRDRTLVHQELDLFEVDDVSELQNELLRIGAELSALPALA